MSFGEAALRLLKEHLVPEVGEIKQTMVGFARVQEALVARLEALERRIEETSAESGRRFEALDRRIEENSAESSRRFEALERRIEERSAEHTRRMDLLEKRIEEKSEEHSRRMDLLERRMDFIEKRMERVEKRMERVESVISGMNDRLVQLTEAVAKLVLLGDHVRRVDELAMELREVRRRQDDFERRFADEVLPRLPKVGT